MPFKGFFINIGKYNSEQGEVKIIDRLISRDGANVMDLPVKFSMKAAAICDRGKVIQFALYSLV